MKVLIADDDATSRILLDELLTEWHYETVTARDGHDALALLSQPEAPHLAIIDWMMPGLDGLEVCEAIKGRGEAKYTYIIILTSRREKEDVIAGFDAGADDFLVKPVEPLELRSRLAAGRRVLQYEERVREYAEKMELLAQQRAQQLLHADRLATLGTLAAGIAHEINNALAGVSGNVQLVEEFWRTAGGSIVTALRQSNDRQSLMLAEEMPKILAAMDDGGRRISGIVKSLRGFSHKGSATGACRINDCVKQALTLARPRLKGGVEAVTDLAADLPAIAANSQQIEQVLINLIVNAADALRAHGGGRLRIATGRNDGFIVIVVEDNGPGIPPEFMDKIFMAFFTTKSVDEGTGLGLAISHGIVEEHGGTMSAENRAEGGARFVIRLPIVRAGEK